MVEGSKQVRVDNWGIFFLQRLQIFFSKTDYCDLTLQFEGNVQLKVHRLVMNACTEYFTYLEQTCPALEEGTIIMPADLQADVIVPIVNFMYTGMLEFHISIFEKLYKAAVIMNITVLTKLLDAQRIPNQSKTQKRKFDEVISPSISIKSVPKPPLNLELPPPLPGRKVPVWKRKTAPASSHSDYSDKWSSDPLMLPDARPKPTRFEWPDEDLPPLPLMDSTFEEISYTSKPLLTQEEEIRAISNVASTSGSLEDVSQTSPNHSKKNVSKPINENSPEEKTRTKSESSGVEEIILFGGEEYNEVGQKRKGDTTNTSKVKRSKNGDKENKETSINVKANTSELDHTKIVSEILKKYPNLVRKNKNIKLKIMPVTTPTKKTPPEKPIPGFNEIRRKVVRADSSTTIAKQKLPTKTKKKKERISLDGPWICDKCDGNPVEFVLYYLYRKHMTDIHNEVFDIRLCKYCGQKCSKPNLMMYHLLTKHGLKPPATYAFPKCDQCPFIALAESKLILHKQKHQANEMQCTECKLAFTNQSTLTTHLQITGHLNRSARSSFDCQYCTKKLQSAINLFSHIKNTHFKEAKKDGIVGLDELEELDDEDDNSEEEYIIPEILTENDIQKDKVKIISNVKVQNRQDQATSHNQQQLVPLVQTSEADSLNSVTGSIATSLGLVDIVVLDDNQQYILQENQEQTEFILPELSSGESHFGAQVITTQHNSVIPQGVLQASGTDITSTDELVMVLTDHDYQEGHEGENADNSNIVVLYSHPVDGQQGQFITSQGNLLVNSQTGMLELRNGTTITTTSNQLVVNSNEVESPIESIEMIQREIQSQQELEARKQNTTDHPRSKQVGSNTVSLEELTGEQVIINEFTGRKRTIMQESTDNEINIQIERTEIDQGSKQNPEVYLAHEDVQDTCVETIEMQGNISEEKADNTAEHTEESGISDPGKTPAKTSEVAEIDTIKDISDNKDSTDGNNLQELAEGQEDEPMEIEETHTTDVITTDTSKIAEVEETPMEECETTTTVEHQEQLLETVENNSIENPVGVDVPPETVNTLPESVDIQPGDIALSHDLSSKDDTPIEDTDANPEQVDICPTETISAKKVESTKHFVTDVLSPTPLSGNDQETDSPINVEEMEVDGPDKEEMAEKETQNVTKSQQTDTLNSETLQECVINIDDDQNKKDEQSETEDLSNASVAEQAEDEDEEDSCFVEKDENSVVPESCIKSPPKNTSAKTNPNINREILQDWEEDTDSQQSEKQNTPKDNAHQVETESDSSKDGQRQAAVDKLMNDWEDDEEEEKKDECN